MNATRGQRGMDFQKRADDNFAKANHAISKETEQLIAGHAAKGMLNSGGTAKLAIEIYEQKSGEALNQSLIEMGKQIDHRGKRWDTAASQIEQALAKQIELAPTILHRPLGLAGVAKNTDAGRAVDRLLTEAATRLRGQLSEFRDGWTAPIPALWKERHPYLHDISLLVVGGVISLIVAWIGGYLGGT